MILGLSRGQGTREETSDEMQIHVISVVSCFGPNLKVLFKTFDEPQH